MTRSLKIILAILFIIAVIGIALFIYIKMHLPANEKRVSFNNATLINKIDKQLTDVDIKRVHSKEHYISQKSVAEIQHYLKTKMITHEDLVAYYLLRIKKVDQASNGNNAVSEVNDNAIKEAREYDKLSNDNLALKGIPILVKENINTDDMPTSAGTIALKDFIPDQNAPLIDKLKENGAIILGKTNLSELSFYMSTHNPLGYSAKKGQTHNPFNPLKISPSGSSSGSAVAAATDLATITIGTETSGSIVSPASVNSVVGFKPSHDKINGEGIIPISYHLDTPGPITRNVTDAALTYKLASYDTMNLPVDKDYIKGKRIGLITELTTNDDFWKDLKTSLEKMGAEIVDIDIKISSLSHLFILQNDFEKNLNHYLKTYKAPVKSLKELVSFNKKDKKIGCAMAKDF
ncbi:amidase family protein [Streptococcus didelphis]|uniref:Amidase family protein n=1 Tax=Streptococcus didelphis TaxID=102886 RepID=A0ABY9LG41_9STRE|nr:amidase family protein [Streptococcus didelphis]WMB27820.1 amidase family protein [Streptococcus didelphis]